MQKLLFLAFASTVAVVAGGCAGLAMPNMASPGTAQAQRARAERFDPYPETASGRELAGARPRDYDQPVLVPSNDPWPWARSAPPR